MPGGIKDIYRTYSSRHEGSKIDNDFYVFSNTAKEIYQIAIGENKNYGTFYNQTNVDQILNDGFLDYLMENYSNYQGILDTFVMDMQDSNSLISQYYKDSRINRNDEKAITVEILRIGETTYLLDSFSIQITQITSLSDLDALKAEIENLQKQALSAGNNEAATLILFTVFVLMALVNNEIQKRRKLSNDYTEGVLVTESVSMITNNTDTSQSYHLEEDIVGSLSVEEADDRRAREIQNIIDAAIEVPSKNIEES
jgi:hypothetical protein